MASETDGSPARLEVVGGAASETEASEVAAAAEAGVAEVTAAGVEATAPDVELPRAAPAAPADEPRASRPGFWLLVVLLLLAALGLVMQTQRVGELEGRVAGLDAELSVARQEIEAYEGQLGSVRGLVDDLGARVEELRTLLQPEPPEVPEEAL